MPFPQYPGTASDHSACHLRKYVDSLHVFMDISLKDEKVFHLLLGRFLHPISPAWCVATEAAACIGVAASEAFSKPKPTHFTSSRFAHSPTHDTTFSLRPVRNANLASPLELPGDSALIAGQATTTTEDWQFKTDAAVVSHLRRLFQDRSLSRNVPLFFFH